MSTKNLVALAAMLVHVSAYSQIWQITAAPDTAYTTQGLTVSIVGTGTNFTSATTTYIINGGNVVYASSWTPLSPTSIQANFSIPPQFPLGPCSIRVEEQGNVTWYGAYHIKAGIPPGNVGRISGRLYNDANANCVYDLGETPIANNMVSIQPGNYSTITAADGTYQIWLPLGSYTVQHTPLLGHFFVCPVLGSYNANLTFNGQSITGQDFAVNTLPGDAYSNALTQSLRPGFDSYMYGLAMATYQVPVPGSSFKMVKPSFASLNFASPPGYTVSNDTLIWPMGTFSTTQNFQMNVHVPANIPLGTPFDLWTRVSTLPQDPVPSNDVFTINRVVGGSYDPNDKQVFTTNGTQADGDLPLSDSSLVYWIRFQNTGTDTAFNVYVRDTLDNVNLDLGSFRFLGASHPFAVNSTQAGQLQVTFTNIQLPDSGVNEPASHGWFMYQVNRKANTTPGTIIPNSASIYFDFNAPVKTNTVHTRYCDEVAAAFAPTLNGLMVQFTDQSTGTVNGRLWDFGDGSTSTQTSPSHTYTNPGTYNVCLITTGVCRNDTTCASITVCSGSPQSTYSAAPSGLSVAFTNATTNAVTYHWDFGDGGTSTQASPSHTYTSNGTYTVCLISTSSCGDSDTLCNSVTVCVAPAAAFTAAPPSTGLVAFTDQSNSATSWQWTFGDGGISTQQHPSHQYASDGNYTVCLIVSSGCASDTSCFNVAVCDVPVLPAFTSTPSGLSVSFSDLSSNAVSYAWDFGDGSTSTTQNPSHAYAQVGSYTVCLTITSACNRSATQCATVNVCVPPVATWTYTQPSPGTLVFTDGSQYATSWLWSFGNGATSGTPNPSHTYTQNATVTVCLTSSNSCGTDSTCLTIPVCPATLQAGFAVNPNQFTYTFTDQSFGANQWAWDFGDGGSSTAQSPSHTYAANGTYNVCLTASNECSTTSVICHPVTVQVVGIGNALPGFEISLRPNPMTDKAILYVGNPGVMGEYQLQIYDLRGAKVSELPGEFNQNLELQRNGMAAGLYTFRVMSDGVQIGFGRVVME